MNKKQIDILNDFFLHSALHMMTLEEQCLRKVCEPDLSIKELHVIEAVSCLSGEGGNTMAEIAKYLHISPASLTTAVNVLVQKKYIDREYSSDDRRVILLTLTESGMNANRRYLDFVRKIIYYIGRDLDEGASDAMIGALLKLSECLENGADGIEDLIN